MDVRNGVRAIAPILLWASLHLLTARAQAEPLYTVIDLGTGAPTLGTNSNGQGTVTGSNGLTYAFDPTQSGSPPQGLSIPNVAAPPVGSPDAYGNPAYAYSNSTLDGMSTQGLAAALDVFGVYGHIGNSEAFAVQLQANGSWGTPLPLWAGVPEFGMAVGDGILGITPSGQILGFGYNMGQPPSYDANLSGYGLLLYDSKSQSYTNLSNLIDSTLSPANTNWFLNNAGVGQIDNQGRILLPQAAYEGDSGPLHTLLLVPQGVSVDPVPAPEPATWAIFATLIGGWMARKRLCHRPRPEAATRGARCRPGVEP
jgi:hypothetical protein